MVSRDDSGGEEPETEIRERSEPIRVYSPTAGRWVYSNDELDPATAAEMDREWRAMPARAKGKAIAAALLFLSPVIVMFALMPFAFMAEGETQERLERAMAMLLLGQLVVAFLIIAVAKLFPGKPGKKGAGETRAG